MESNSKAREVKPDALSIVHIYSYQSTVNQALQCWLCAVEREATFTNTNAQVCPSSPSTMQRSDMTHRAKALKLSLYMEM